MVTQDKYALIGKQYKRFTELYGTKAIDDCRQCFITEQYIKPGSEVLFAGAGEGSDAISAARLGANVTLVDISPTMMDQFIKQLSDCPDASDLSIHTILGDILKQDDKAHFDTVVANFFLNIFSKKYMQHVLAHLISLCKPGGQLIIGDFCPPHGSLLARNTQRLYWYLAATTFSALTQSAIHEPHHYLRLLKQTPMIIKGQKYFSVAGQEVFQSILAYKPAS